MKIGLLAVRDEKGLQQKKKKKKTFLHLDYFGTTYLKPFPDCLQQVRHQRVVPQVGEPNPRAFHIHGARQEETGSCRGQQRMSVCWINVTEHVMESPHRCHNVPVINKGSALSRSLDTQRLELNSVSAFSPSAQTQQKG